MEVDIGDLSPVEVSRIIERIPENSKTIVLTKLYVKDLNQSANQVADHPRYRSSTFVDIHTS